MSVDVMSYEGCRVWNIWLLWRRWMLEDARIYRAYRGWWSPEISKHLMSVDAMRDKTLPGLEDLTFLDMLDVRGCEKLQSIPAYKELVCQSSRQQQQQHHFGQEYLSRTTIMTTTSCRWQNRYGFELLLAFSWEGKVGCHLTLQRKSD